MFCNFYDMRSRICSLILTDWLILQFLTIIRSSMKQCYVYPLINIKYAR